MAAAPELIPEEVSLVEALPVLAKLAGYVVVLGLIFVLRAFVKGLFWLLDKFVQGVTFGIFSSAPGLHAAEQAISSLLGGAIAGIDSHIGYSFHQLARLVDHIGRELYGLAEGAWITVAMLLALMNPAQWGKLWDFLTHHTGATLDYSKKMAAHAERANRATRAQAIPQTVPKLGRLERDIGQVIHTDIPSLRAGTRAVEEEMARVWSKVRGLDRLLGVGVLTGAVALAIARLGGSWIRCRNWRTIGRGVCGLPGQWIDDLLGIVADFFILESICTVLPWLEEAFSLTAAPLIELLTPLGAGLCDPTAGPPELLPLPPLTLPAAPSLALFLP